MKKLLIVAIVFGMAGFVWTRQQSQVRAIAIQNKRLSEITQELELRIQNAQTARETAKERLAELRSQTQPTDGAALNLLSGNSPAEPEKTPEPDPSRQGGWPEEAAFAYFPKQFLTNLNYRLLDGDRLTEEAAAWLGLSVDQRETVNQAFSDLIGKFRLLELQKMQSIPPPSGWITGADPSTPSAMQFDSALTYRIPDLSADIDSARRSFSQQLQQTLGPSRAELINSAADSHIRQNLDDLGAGERVVGFVWEPERDGTHSLWYAMGDARHGEGSFQRVPEKVDPNSQVAYYANLFGVKLPSGL